MNRLTRKIKGYYSVDLRTCLPMEYEQIENSNACVDKLGKLEDIEEELGIDLVTLFKALKCGVCIKDEGYFNNTDIYFHPLEMEFVIEWANKDNMGYECLKDYGKTWALTKEELDNDN